MHISDFSSAELQVILAALFYERRDDPVMSDASFDILIRSLRHMHDKVVGFSTHTGMWVAGITTSIEWDMLLDECEIVMRSYNKRELHCPVVDKALDNLIENIF